MLTIAPHIARRARLAGLIGQGVAVVATAPEQVRNADNHFPFRYDSTFHYLTAFPEPEAVLVLMAGESPRSILFCREKDMEREIWDGFRHGPDAAKSLFGFDEAYPIARLDELMPSLLENQPSLYSLLGDDVRWDAFCRKRDAVAREMERLKSTWVHPGLVSAADAERLLGKALEHEYNLADLLRRPGVEFDRVAELAGIAKPELAVSRETLRAELGESLADAVIEQVQIGIKYAGYIDKQNEEVERAAAYENLRLPAELDYAQVSALSFEVRQKLARHKPETLGQASRISGVTPAAISLLLIHLRKGRFKGFAANTESVSDAA